MNDSIEGRRALAQAAWHSLLWLTVANGIGVLLALMLLFPGVNALLGSWTYGHWMPVHMNLQLYGWMSLPLVGFLLIVYGSHRSGASQWISPALCLWSATLAIASYSWLDGHTSGKLFLDWTGYPRVLFPIALTALWALLVASLFFDRRVAEAPRGVFIAKLTGLALLLPVPVLLYVASSPTFYPPINPDTGGPTGASQLESTLVVIAILLLLPFGLTHERRTTRPRVSLAWIIFFAECGLCLAMGRTDVSHHRPMQWISLGSLLVWVPLTPLYYAAFHWHQRTRRWRIAFLCWWSLLVPTGWVLFLPGILERFKFTDGLVGHSFLAMAGFVSSLLIFILTELMQDDAWIFHRAWSFYGWQSSVALYVALMFLAGWREGTDPSFTITPGLFRNGIYATRLMLGIVLLAASADWLFSATTVLRRQISKPASQEQAVLQ